MPNSDTTNDENVRITSQKATQYRCLDPRRKRLKFVILNLLSFLPLGASYSQNFLGLLKNDMQNAFNVSSSTVDLFNALSLWPTVIFPIIGGLLIDKWLGVARSAILFCGLVVSGQILLTIGGYAGRMSLMIIGSIICNIGAESLAVAQNVYTAAWFFGRLLQLAFGWHILWSRIIYIFISADYSSATNTYSSSSIGVLFLACSFSSILSLISTLFLWRMDIRRRQIIKEDSSINESNKFHLRDIRNFSGSLFCVSIIWVFYLIPTASFSQVSWQFYATKYDLPIEWAHYCYLFIYIMPGILSIILGYIIDKVGRNLLWLIVSLTMAIIAHVLLAFSSVHPVVSCILIGISYSIISTTVLAIIAFLVPRKMLGIAYGFMGSIWNLGSNLTYLYTDSVISSYGIFSLEISLIVCAEIALMTAGFVYISNFVHNGILNDSPYTRLIKQALVENRANSATNPRQ